MKSRTYSAPGKVVLSGEYAVLHGAAAVAAAVDRRANVTIQAKDSPYIELEAPGFQAGRFRYRAAAGGVIEPVDTLPEPHTFDLFERCWRACRADLSGGVLVTLDTTEFVSDGRKLGLGSSAALGTALTAALLDDCDASRVAKTARQVHEGFQGGGSGVDIACAAYGGVIRYRNIGPDVEPLKIPDDFHLAVLWSGQPASTAERIRTLSAGLQSGEGRATLDDLAKEANALARCWQAGNAAALIEQYPRFNVALEAFDADHNLDIYGAGHAELAAAARQGGIVYKPCGAGGGDVGVAMSLDQVALAGFVDRSIEFGFESLHLAVGARGLRRDG